MTSNIAYIQNMIGRELTPTEINKIRNAMRWGLMNPIDLAREIGVLVES